MRARLAISTVLLLTFALASQESGALSSAPADVDAIPDGTVPDGMVPDDWWELVPDVVGDHRGGTAARVRTEDGEAVGNLFLLMGLPGSSSRARVFDRTPFQWRNVRVDAETEEANSSARRLAERWLGEDVERRDLTVASGGGASGGLVHLLAYLELGTGGEFTGGVRIAASGHLRPGGYVNQVTAVPEKTQAAAAAGAEVLFLPTALVAGTEPDAVARSVGALHRTRSPRIPIEAERRWDEYEEWGRTRPVEGTDVVSVRHVGDVAAYLCGAGSARACGLVDVLAASGIANEGTGRRPSTVTSTATAAPPVGGAVR